MVGMLVSQGLDAAATYEAAQRDWFQRGQTGCVFARLVAAEPLERWPFITISNELTDPAVQDLRDRQRALELDGSTEILSLLFPFCVSLEEFQGVIERLIEVDIVWCEREVQHERGVTLEIRRTVNGVTSWVMAFGPADSLPMTRQAPFYELVYRVKPKPNAIFRNLNQDREIAHLADYPLEMSELRWEHRWQSTEHRTRTILGGEPDYVSSAKATLTIPLTS